MKKFATALFIALALFFSIRSTETSAHIKDNNKVEQLRLDYAPNQYFVKYRKSFKSEQIGTRYGLRVQKSFSTIDAVTVQLDDPSILASLQNDPDVEFIEPVPMRYKMSLSTNQLLPAIENGLYGLVTTKANQVHQRGIMGTGINVGVADTGLDYKHPDIAPNYKGGIDAVSNDNDPWWNEDPAENHGTHVAGTIVAANNSVGVLGVAPSANLFHARVLGPRGGTAADVMEGVQWLVETAGCRVVNLSLGGGGKSKIEEEFYAKMRSKGAVIVCASGNEAAKRPSYPANYKTNIAVGAVDSDNEIAPFSNTGKRLDIVAPGVRVLSSLPTNTSTEAFIAANSEYQALPLLFSGLTEGVNKPVVDCKLGKPGDFPAEVAGNIALIRRGDNSFAEKVLNAMQAGAAAVIIFNNDAGNFLGTLNNPKTPDGKAWIPAVSVSDVDGAQLLKQASQSSATVVNKRSSWGELNGTSMATPHVSGVVALIFAANPSLTPAQAEDILLSTAVDLGTVGFDTIYGRGLVNAAAAVEKALK